MSVIEVDSQEQLDELLAAGPVVLNFSARSWCIPCQRLWPHYVKAAEALEWVDFIEVDADAHSDIAAFYNVMAVPTVLKINGDVVEPLVARTAIQIVKEANDFFPLDSRSST